MLQDDLKELFNRSLKGHLSPGEVRLLQGFILDKNNEALLDKLLQEAFTNSKLAEKSDYDLDFVFREVMVKAEAASSVRLRKSHFRQYWYGYAATLLVAVGMIGYRMFHIQQPAQKVQSKFAVHTPATPGTNKAVLTLGGGKQIMLDSTTEGTIAVEQGTTIINSAGQLFYKNISDNAVAITNTIATPRGGQYRVILPDGSQVLLNAASSLRFPSAFTGNRRQVELTGEGYFEISGSASKPFFVRTGGLDVQVLGTHFGIMGYGDEKVTKVTLAEGAVKVFTGRHSVMLKPGQQAVAPRDASRIDISDTGTDEALAWTTGKFRFNNTPVDVIMRQVARWYDVKVEYRDDLSEITLTGLLSRRQEMSHLLSVLEMTKKVHFISEGDKIIVTRYRE